MVDGHLDRGCAGNLDWLTKPFAKLWSAPFGEIWTDIRLLGDWRWAAKDTFTGLELFLLIAFLLYAILWVRRGTEYFEGVLSSPLRQCAFLIAVFVTGVFITPHLHIESDKPCSTSNPSTSNR
jgi:hypothetical protein